MKEPEQVLAAGTRIRTHDVIDGNAGILVKKKYLNARRVSTEGNIAGFVPGHGHGGDVYWVVHDDDTVAVYGWEEFELVAAPPLKALYEILQHGGEVSEKAQVAIDSLLGLGYSEDRVAAAVRVLLGLTS